MPRKQKQTQTRYARAGLPLARAKRLKTQTDALTKSRSGGIFGLSVLSVSAIVAIGVLDDGKGGYAFAKDLAGLNWSDVTGAFGPAETSFPPEALVTAPEPLNIEDPAELTSLAPQVIAPVAPAITDSTKPEPTATPTQPVAALASAAPLLPSPDAPACVQAVESRLGSLSLSAQQMVPWIDLQDELGTLVQSTLDCDAAGVQIVGSLALAATEFADIRLRWDRDAYILELATVAHDAADRQMALVDTRSVELVFR
ncbi:MAG: hypothetical protein AAFZ99_16665 [Pseudomonadota bacterium]